MGNQVKNQKMKSELLELFRVVVPYKLRAIPYFALENYKINNYKKEILHYFENHPEAILNEEQAGIINFLRNHPLTSIPYPQKTAIKDIKVYFDQQKGLHFVLLDQKKLYYKKGYHPLEIRKKFHALLIEQDFDSPHRYLTPEFSIQENEVIIDAGSAEANFALSVVERAKRLILIETDPGWIKALEATFEPWNSKVKIINKFVSDKNDSSCITMDKIVQQEGRVDFVKIDVDGEESKLFKGFEETLNSGASMKIALCTYHKANDSKEFSELLSKFGFNVTLSKGYMIFITRKNVDFPYFRKGLIRASR